MARTDVAGTTRTRWRRLGAARRHVRRTSAGRIAWRIAVTVAGVSVIIIGIILLPLPGPGWLVIFGGLGLLATEYEWAARLLAWARGHVRRWTQWIAAQPVWVRLVAGFVSLLVIAGLAVAALFGPL
jgi:uncharacterized protein (TIGR02611 family)